MPRAAATPALAATSVAARRALALTFALPPPPSLS